MNVILRIYYKLNVNFIENDEKLDLIKKIRLRIIVLLNKKLVFTISYSEYYFYVR